MIVVKVELHSATTKEVSEIGRMYIANVGGTMTQGEYDVAVCRKNFPAVPQPINPDGPRATRSGHVSDYARLNLSVWKLVTRSLLSCFSEERNR